MCNNGNDVRMNPYIVVGTGDEVGMVEIVPNSDTLLDANGLVVVHMIKIHYLILF